MEVTNVRWTSVLEARGWCLRASTINANQRRGTASPTCWREHGLVRRKRVIGVWSVISQKLIVLLLNVREELSLLLCNECGRTSWLFHGWKGWGLWHITPIQAQVCCQTVLITSSGDNVAVLDGQSNSFFI